MSTLYTVSTPSFQPQSQSSLSILRLSTLAVRGCTGVVLVARPVPGPIP